MTHLPERCERERVRSQALLESRPGSINPDRDTGAQVDQPAGPAKNNTNKAKWERTGGCLFVSISRSAGKSFDPGGVWKVDVTLGCFPRKGSVLAPIGCRECGTHRAVDCPVMVIRIYFEYQFLAFVAIVIKVSSTWFCFLPKIALRRIYFNPFLSSPINSVVKTCKFFYSEFLPESLCRYFCFI